MTGLVKAPGTLKNLKLALHASAELPVSLVEALVGLTSAVVRAGGSVVVASSSALLTQPGFKASLVGNPETDQDGINPEVPVLEPFLASLQYGGSLRGLLPGLHVMHVPVKMTWSETLTGLGAAGCHAVMVCHQAGKKPGPAHPFVPTLQVTTGGTSSTMDVDLSAAMPSKEIEAALIGSLAEVLSGTTVPRANSQGNTDFQISRGHTGISL